MGKVKVTKELAGKFTPIKVKLEFAIESQTELEDFKLEFKDGRFAGYSTDYSTLVFNIINQLDDLSKEL